MGRKKKAVQEQVDREVAAQEVREQADMDELAKDKCPLCKELVINFPYTCIIPPPYVWMECPKCGVVFCPLSIRKRKLQAEIDARNMVQPATTEEMPPEPTIEVVGGRNRK